VGKYKVPIDSESRQKVNSSNPSAAKSARVGHQNGIAAIKSGRQIHKQSQGFSGAGCLSMNEKTQSVARMVRA